MNADDYSFGEELGRAERYRSRAEELRTMATNGLDPTIESALLQIALDYEAMARTMENIHRTNIAIQRSRTAS